MPGDMRPGTECGMMWGFSGEVTLWVLFGGRPGLELEEEEGKKGTGETTGSDRRRNMWLFFKQTSTVRAVGSLRKKKSALRLHV